MKTLTDIDEALDLTYKTYQEFKSSRELTELHWARHERGLSAEKVEKIQKNLSAS